MSSCRSRCALVLTVAFQRKKPAAIGVKAPFPGFIEPALASSIEKVPTGERWIHEIKFDGYRVQVHLANDRGQGVHPARPRLDQSLQEDRRRRLAYRAGSAIIDGEIVVPAADGTTDFSVLQNELKGRSTRIVMVAFDLLYLNGYDLRKLPLIERKAHLKKLIAETDIQFSESFEVDGREMYRARLQDRPRGRRVQGRGQPLSCRPRTTGSRKPARSARR